MAVPQHPRPVVTGMEPQASSVTGPPRSGVPHGTKRRRLKTKVSKPKPDPLSLPAGPGSSYTVRDLRRLEAAAANQKYGPGIRAAQLGMQAIPHWFEAYRAQIAQAQQAQGQRTTDAVTALKGLASSAAAVDPNATPEAQAAARVRGETAGGQTQLAQLLGDNQGTFLQNLGLLTNVNQIAELGKAASKIADLQQLSRDFKETYGQDLLSNEAKQKLEAAAFGLDEFKAKQTALNDRSLRRDRAHDNRSADAKDRAAADKDAYQRVHGLGPYKPAAKPKAPKAERPRLGPGSLTQGEETKLVQKVKNAKAAAVDFYRTHPNAPSGDVRHALATGFNPSTGKYDLPKYDHDVINAAFDLLPTDLGGRGGLSPANVKALRRMGIHVDRYFKKLRPVRRGTVKQGDTKNDLP